MGLNALFTSRVSGFLPSATLGHLPDLSAPPTRKKPDRQAELGLQHMWASRRHSGSQQDGFPNPAGTMKRIQEYFFLERPPRCCENKVSDVFWDRAPRELSKKNKSTRECQKDIKVFRGSFPGAPKVMSIFLVGPKGMEPSSGPYLAAS